MWIGITFLADVGWGVGLLGIGIILLWVEMGILFVLAEAWELLSINLGQELIPDGRLPILSIVVGVVLVVSALLRKRHLHPSAALRFPIGPNGACFSHSWMLKECSVSKGHQSEDV